ncbi:hypothetical protein PRZ48_014276 [Zasmidium cellare]|uniref:Methyltransferase domain-containing protein n=1 Tax=Zasmidium cellare TaxID=395010 RepID=A0ABR0E0Y3_ZASCE|nr:hypothetical protein PRZ48_014276 [Zasmidium cellare]
MAAKVKDNNAFCAGNSDIMRNAMQTRRLATDIPHVTPLLDALPAGAIVLEVGCGPGGMTLDIAQRYPELLVLGIDIDKQSIKQAKEAATKAGTTNVRYSVGDAVELAESASEPGFEAINGGCDLVYTHAALMHTGDPLRAVRQCSLATKPGGTITMKEGDMGLFFAYPDLPGMNKLLEVFPKLSAAKGADGRLGRKLISHLLAAGHTRDDITEVDMSTSILSRPEHRQGMRQGFDQIFADVASKPEWMESCGITEADIKLIRETVPQWAEAEDGILAFPSIHVVCRKRN